MKIIIGLGNKGSMYQKTRHNIGEHVVRVIGEAMGGEFKYNKYILSNTCTIGDVQFVIPELFMNESGKVIDGLFKIPKEEYSELLIVRDDIDMSIGNIKTIFDGGTGGHNGIRSINEHLKNQKYHQIKIGVLPVDEQGKVNKPASEDMADFVTGKFTRDEWDRMEDVVKRVVVMVQEFIKG